MRRRRAALVVIGSAAVSLSVLSGSTAAWAPPMVTAELAAQRALGYKPCEPIIGQLPPEVEAEGVYADADNGIQSGKCEVRFAPSIPANLLQEVAWHEICHLSTVEPIAQRADRDAYGDDWAHDHPLFKECMAAGGWGE